MQYKTPLLKEEEEENSFVARKEYETAFWDIFSLANLSFFHSFTKLSP